MAAIVQKDRVRDTTTSTGTDNLTLSGTAPTGFVNFNTAFGTSVYFEYAIEGGAEWETGLGHLSASTTLVRDDVYESSNSNAAVNFSAGTKAVRCTVPAHYFSDNILHLLSSTVVDTDVGTKQTLYTVPTGKKCVVTEYVVRSAGADLSTYAVDGSIGFDAGATDVNDALVWGNLTDATIVFMRKLNGVPVKLGSAADVLGIITGQTTVNSTVIIDVFGYLFDA